MLTRTQVAEAIEREPIIASLLYDLDLMPEQIKEGDERRWGYCVALVWHVNRALKEGKRRGRRKP